MLNFLCNLRGFLQQDLLARFCKESSLAKQEMLPDIGTRFFLQGRRLCVMAPSESSAYGILSLWDHGEGCALPHDADQITWTWDRGKRIWRRRGSRSCCSCRSLLGSQDAVSGES